MDHVVYIFQQIVNFFIIIKGTQDTQINCINKNGLFKIGNTCSDKICNITPIYPIFNCYEILNFGLCKFYMGYNNTNNRIIEVPKGPYNLFYGSIFDINYTTLFYPVNIFFLIIRELIIINLILLIFVLIHLHGIFH